MGTLPTARVAEVFVEFADTLVEEFDVVEFLQMVASRASDLVAPAAAGLLLADATGRLRFMAASDERDEMLDLFQVQASEGPCHDSFRTGLAVINADLDHIASPWPPYARRAVVAGFRMVHAFPLRLRREVIGVLSLLGTDATALDADDAHTIQALADVATIGLLHERAARQGEILSAQLQGALNSRIVIEQAKGAIAQAHGCGVDEAFGRLRSYCRANNLRLSAVAQAVVTDSLSIPEPPVG